MSILASTSCFRPAPGGVGGVLLQQALAAAPAVLGVLRTVRPILRLGNTVVVTRYDDVKEVFADDRAFGVPYADNLAVITGREPFFLGMGDTAEYRAQLAAMRAVVRPSDLPRLGDEAEARAAEIVAASGGRVEVVGLVRKVAFDLIGAYFGVPEPANGRLDVWGCRLFEFQFTGSAADRAWRAEAETFAAAFSAHIDSVVAARKAAGTGPDDVLQRCLAAQAAGEPGYRDEQIRTALMCMVVGGPPQPPMVVPQAMEQLLQRPDWLQAAGDAARAPDPAAGERLHDIVFEAMRFDPLAPALKRVALTERKLARGTARETTIAKGSTVLVAFSSAMMDGRRIPEPTRFDPGRLPHEYIHFGHGLHECFGRAINHATLHRMLRPLLARPGLRRADGRAGHLCKAGAFAERLEVCFDP